MKKKKKGILINFDQKIFYEYLTKIIILISTEKENYTNYKYYNMIEYSIKESSKNQKFHESLLTIFNELSTNYSIKVRSNIIKILSIVLDNFNSKQISQILLIFLNLSNDREKNVRISTLQGKN
jgi:hypothetical protein